MVTSPTFCGRVLVGDGELDVIALAQAAQGLDVVVILGDQGAHFAAGHLQILAGGCRGRCGPR